MSQNSSGKQAVDLPSKRSSRRWLALALPFWVLAGFTTAQLLVTGVVTGLHYLGVTFAEVNRSIFDASAAAVIYVLTALIVIGVPWWIKNKRTTKEDIGLWRLPTWADIGLAPAGFIIYFLASAIIMYAVTQLVPGFNPNEEQRVGFENLVRYYEYILAFVTLVILVPFAEELLFRGYLYGKLRKVIPIWAAIAIVSVLFGFIHGMWNVGIDVFVLSIVMCGLREITGSIWAGILLHSMKNGLAFYLLFINPSLLNTMG